MCLSVLVDLLQDVAGQSNVCPDSFRRFGFYGNQDRNAGSVVGIGHNLLKAGSLGDSLSDPDQAINMKGQGFFSHRLSRDATSPFYTPKTC